MNLNVRLGKDALDKDIYLDLDKEKLHLILLIGATGTGKSIFHNNLYRELARQNSPDDIGFVFLDMTRVNFMGWRSPYLFLPPATGNEAMDVLEKIAEESRLRVSGKKDATRAIFVQMEECDLFYSFPERIKKALTSILADKAKNNIYIIFSTSRPSPKDVIQDWLLELTDLKVVFQLASTGDCRTLGLGDAPFYIWETGQRFLVYGGKMILCKPFTAEQAEELVYFNLTDRKLYLDVDGVLLQKDGQPANHLDDFLGFALFFFECYWLTTHCKGDNAQVLECLRGKVSAKTFLLLKLIHPTHWQAYKTEAIDFSSDFLWLDDYLLLAEKQILEKNNCLGKYIKMDLLANPNQLQEIREQLRDSIKI